MLIKNAFIRTAAGDPIENGWILSENGIITEIGSGEPPVYAGEVYDAEGGGLTPGFIDAHTHLGMSEEAMGFEGNDSNEATNPVTPHLRAIDAINPNDGGFDEALSYGVTTVVTGPGSANPIGGIFAAIHTVGRRVDDMIVKDGACMKFALGENPKRAYSSKGTMPSTRMGTAAVIRENLIKANEYAKKRATNPDTPFDMKLEALVDVVQGKMPAHFHAHREDDIFTAIRIAKEFSLDYVIVHCSAGHNIADILAEEGVRAITGPILGNRTKIETKDRTIAGPGIMSKAGMEVAICTDHPVIPQKFLALSAAYARKYGLPDEDALRAITINAAKMVHIDDKVGSIEKGKLCDVCVFDGCPFEVDSSVKAVFIEGRRVK